MGLSGLKCMLIRLEETRLSLKVVERDLLFIVNADEESRVLARVKESHDRAEVLLSVTLSRPLGQDLAEQDLLEIRRLLKPETTLGIGEESSSSPRLAELVCEALLRGVKVVSVETAMLEIDPSVSADPSEAVRTLALAGLYQGAGLRAYTALKHVMEPALASLLLLLISPLFAAVALLVRMTSVGPVFYRQTRLGYRGRHFDIIKFRSMRTDAEKDGPVWASASKTDSRLTSIGGFLRATHLDELPQIWNVVRGEVSFVGPRPERPVFCQELEEKIPLFKLRTLVKPGITGWAQIRAGYANSVDDSRRKLEFDLYYILKHSPVLDLRILMDTLAILFSGGSEGRKRERLVASQMRPRQRAVLSGLTRRPVASPEGAGAREKTSLANAEIS